MSSVERRAFGARVADVRRRRGLTQTELATAIGRTASWLSQVERGVQPVNRLDVLRLLADGLGVPLQALQPDAPTAAAAAPTGQANGGLAQAGRARAAHVTTVGSEWVPQGAAGQVAEIETNDLDQVRLILSGHPAVDASLGLVEHFEPGTLDELREAVNHAWELTHANRFAQLSSLIDPLVPRLERATRTAAQEYRDELHALLARVYQALAAAFVRQDEADAAWVAADRAIRAAELSGDPLGVFVGVYRLAHSFVRLRRLDQAEHAAAAAVAALQRHVDQKEPTPQCLSVLGSLHLTLALVHARAGERSRARECIAEARRVAERLGQDRNDYDLEFGPTNVEIHAVSIAVDLGDAGEALDIGGALDVGAVSVERQARLLMDLGRAHVQRRQSGEALECLLRAEQLAPEMIRSHIAAREAVRELLLVAGRVVTDELRGLAERADALL